MIGVEAPGDQPCSAGAGSFLRLRDKSPTQRCAAGEDSEQTQIRRGAGGGTVIMTGYSAKVDETGKWFETPLPGRLADVFGLRTNAFYRHWEPLKVDYAGATLSGRSMLHFRHYKRVPLAMMCVSLACCATIAWQGRALPFWLMEVLFALLSMGIGTILPLSPLSIPNAVETHQLGIATAAIANVLGGEEGMKRCRKPEIMADAAYAILNRPGKECTGNFFIDDEVLAAEGVTDLDKYAYAPGHPLMPDFFVPAPGARTVVGRG